MSKLSPPIGGDIELSVKDYIVFQHLKDIGSHKADEGRNIGLEAKNRSVLKVGKNLDFFTIYVTAIPENLVPWQLFFCRHQP